MTSPTKCMRDSGIEVAQGNPPCALPKDVAQAQTVLAACEANGWRVLPQGRGTQWRALHHPSAFDLAISTKHIPGELAYDPAEGVMTAPAHMAWSELQTLARDKGQHLSPDFRGRDLSLGGAIAMGLSGMDRERFGALRHQVLGLRVLVPDGRLAQVGGRLVKNVTGFDLVRLFTGSRGSLGIILQASLRVWHAPQAQHLCLLSEGDVESALHLWQRLHAERVPETSYLWTQNAPDQARLFAHCAGTSGAVRDALAALRLLTDMGDSTEIAEHNDRFAAGWNPTDLEPSLHVTCSPSEWPEVYQTLSATWQSGPSPQVYALPSTSEMRVRFTGSGAEQDSLRQDLQRALPQTRASWRWYGGPAGIEATASDSKHKCLRAAQDALLRQFDPHSRLQPKQAEVVK